MNDVVDGMEYTIDATQFPPALRDEIDAGYIEGISRWNTESAQRKYYGWDTNNSTDDMMIASTVTPGGQVRIPLPVNDLTIRFDENNVILSWTPVPFASSYNIFKSSSPVFSGAISTVNTTANTWIDRWVMITNEQGYYQVVSVGDDPTPPPHKVQELTIKVVGGSVRLNWACTVPEARYNIYRCLEPDFPEGHVELVHSNYPLLWWIDHGALSSPRYYYRITCVRDESGVTE